MQYLPFTALLYVKIKIILTVTIPVFSIWPHVLIHITHYSGKASRHLEKNHLAFLIYPLLCLAGISWDAESIASRREIWSCGRWSKNFFCDQIIYFSF